MTFSILLRDPATGTLGGAAATGSLCVGGWVLRGDLDAGLSASQGAAPSTFWGADVLTLMRDGAAAETAVKAVTGKDRGREWRQLAALDTAGTTGTFTGAHNTAWRGARAEGPMVAAGNLLTGPAVLDSLIDGVIGADGTMADRLVEGLRAAQNAGGDSRGLQSAALLVLHAEAPPLSLRIDWAEDPIAALAALLARTREAPYAQWLDSVPTRADPERGNA